MFDGYEELANAIIAQAGKDYKIALLMDNRKMKRECEEFFRSQWYEFLTDVDGEYLIEQIRKEVRRD